jgi:hypothetical protein
MSRWAGKPVLPALQATPARSSGRGWTIAGLLLVAAGVGWYVLRPRVEHFPGGRKALVVTPPTGFDRTVAVAVPLPGGAATGAT